MTLPAGSTDLNGAPMRIRNILRFFDSAQFPWVSGGSVTLPYGVESNISDKQQQTKGTRLCLLCKRQRRVKPLRYHSHSGENRHS